MEGVISVSMLSSIGLGISSFCGIFLLKHRKLENRILAWLLISLSLRITKSIFYIYLDLPLTVKNLGLAANLAVGPLLYLYVMMFLGREKLAKSDLLHFVPSIFYILCAVVLPNGGESMFWRVSYSMILFQSFSYVFLAIATLYRSRRKSKDVNRIWSIIGSLLVMWLVYAMIFFNFLPLYALGPLTFSILSFVLMFIAMNHQKLFAEKSLPKYLSSRVSDKEGKDSFYQLKGVIESEKLYKNSNLSLAYLASKMGVLERDISLLINKYGNHNFSQFVNNYRVEEAKRLMMQDASQKVISIAYQSGFNNLSTFNHAFKSFTGLTPSEFRKMHERD